MKILIVGGAGYIGGALVDYIQHHTSDNAHVYDNLLYERQYMKNVSFHYGDIRERHKLLRLIEGEDYDVIVVGDPACSLNPELTKEINEDSVKWLASVAGDRRIVFMSTCSVYGSNEKRNLEETDDTNPLSTYASTKLEAESYLADKNAVIFRLGTVYGLGDRFARPRFDLVVNIMTANMVKNGSLTVFGGDQMRPIVHVKDIARAIYYGCVGGQRGIYNMNMCNMRIDEIAQRIQDTLGTGEIKVTEREGDGMDARDYSVSGAKFDRDFKMPFLYPLERAIAEIAHAIAEARIKNHKHPVFNNKLNIEEKLSE
jgi:nucleoside-diphosphate-sugar epimerase